MEPEKKRKVSGKLLRVRMDDALWELLENQSAIEGVDRSKYVRQLIRKPRAFPKSKGHQEIVLLTRIANDLDMIAGWTQREQESVDAQLVILHLLHIERLIRSESMTGGVQL